MKKCSKCLVEKNLSEFYTGLNYRDGLCGTCKECKINYSREYRKLNPPDEEKKKYLLRRVSERAKMLKEIVLKAKEKPCADCGCEYHYVCMDFDHVFGEKLFNIGNYSHVGKQILIDELAKCEVVCSNCHRIRTWNRNQFNKKWNNET